MFVAVEFAAVGTLKRVSEVGSYFTVADDMKSGLLSDLGHDSISRLP